MCEIPLVSLYVLVIGYWKIPQWNMNHERDCWYGVLKTVDVTRVKIMNEFGI